MLLVRKFFSHYLCFVLLLRVIFGDDFGKNNTNASADGALERKWISQLFAKGQQNFDMDMNVNAACKRDFETYKMHLRNSTVWAIRMLESSEWPTVGIYSGMTDRLGNWYECLMVSNQNVTGQYCLVSATYEINQPPVTQNSKQGPNEAGSVWTAIETLQKNPYRVSRKDFKWAVCVPASCQRTDIENSLRSTLHPIFAEQGLDIAVNVNPDLCTTSKEESYSLGFYLVCGLLGTLFGLTILAAAYEYLKSIRNEQDSDKNDDSSVVKSILEAFSPTRNYKNLVKIPPYIHGGGINFMKLSYICFIIYGHRAMYFIGYPKFNPEFWERDAYSVGNTSNNIRALLFVEVFFAISGFLTFHLEFLRISKKGFSYVMRTIIQRWARMVPVFLILVLFIIYILPYTSEGPQWQHRIQIEVENCRTNFWQNFFVVSNIFDTDKMCLYTSWYISADVQLTIIGCFLIMVIAKHESYGIFLTIFTFIVATVTTIVITYVNKYHAILQAHMRFLEEMRDYEDFTRLYVSTYVKCSSYFMGFGAAIITKKLRENKYTFSNKQIFWIGSFCFALRFLVLLYIPQLCEFVKDYDRLENAFNAALLRSLFVLPDCLLLCIYFTSGWGIYQKLFDLDIWMPLGRLLYCVFLVHTVLQLYHASSFQVVMPTFSRIPYMWMYGSDFLYSFTAAAFMHFTMEAPINYFSECVIDSLFREKKSDNKIPPAKNGNANEAFSHKDENIKMPALSKSSD